VVVKKFSSLSSVAALLLVTLSGAILLGCGGDSWSGTWKASTSLGQTTQADGSDGTHYPTFVITKDGDSWTMTDEAGTSKACKLVGDRLVVTEFPDDGWLEMRDDRLVMVSKDGRVFMEFSKE
jgi:hypothetical protein